MLSFCVWPLNAVLQTSFRKSALRASASERASNSELASIIYDKTLAFRAGDGNVDVQKVKGDKTATGAQKETFGTGSAAQSEAGKKGGAISGTVQAVYCSGRSVSCTAWQHCRHGQLYCSRATCRGS